MPGIKVFGIGENDKKPSFSLGHNVECQKGNTEGRSPRTWKKFVPKELYWQVYT